MKGLLVKDMCFLRRRVGLLSILIALTVLYMASDMAQFGQCFMPMLVAMLMTRGIAGDLRPAQGRNLFSLPFTPMTYVVEKYVVGLAFPAALTMVLISIATVIGFQTWEQGAIVCAVMLVVLSVLVAFMVPLLIRFGDHALIALPIVFLGVGLVGFALGDVTWRLQYEVTAWIASLPPAGLAAAALATAALATAPSMAVSRWLLGRREI